MDGRIDAILARLGIGAPRRPRAVRPVGRRAAAGRDRQHRRDGHRGSSSSTSRRPSSTRPGRPRSRPSSPSWPATGPAILCAEHDPVGPRRTRPLPRPRRGPAGRSTTSRARARSEPPRTDRAAAADARPAGRGGRASTRPTAFDEAAVAAGLGRRGRRSVRRRRRLGPTADRRRPPLDAAPGRPPVRIAVEDLAHRYPTGVEALRGVVLTIEPGEAVAIVGQNGSGKTTLVKHLNGLLRPTGGRVTLDGADIRESAGPRAGRHGRVRLPEPRRPAVRPVGRAGGRLRAAQPRPADRRRGGGPSTGALAAVGLDRRPRRRTRTTSTCRVRKLVALASVLAMDPAALVLDEPTTGQDGPGVRRVGAIVDACARPGRTVVAITHDMEFAAEHFGRIVVMRGGTVVADGTPGRGLRARPCDLLRTPGSSLRRRPASAPRWASARPPRSRRSCRLRGGRLRPRGGSPSRRGRNEVSTTSTPAMMKAMTSGRALPRNQPAAAAKAATARNASRTPRVSETRSR